MIRLSLIRVNQHNVPVGYPFPDSLHLLLDPVIGGGYHPHNPQRAYYLTGVPIKRHDPTSEATHAISQ